MSTYQIQKNPFLACRPYVYAIMWTKLNTAYVGVRSAKGCHPNEFWKSYFTSSKYVRDFRKLHGEPDQIEIIECFLTASEATRAEYDIISTFALHYSPLFLNKACGRQVAMTDEVRLARNAKLKGRTRPPEVCAAISQAQRGRKGLVGEANGFFGKKHTPETVAKFKQTRSTLERPPQTEETKRKISEAMRSSPKAANRKVSKHTEETKAKIKASWVIRKAKKLERQIDDE